MKKHLNIIQNLLMTLYLVGVIIKVLDVYEAWIPTLLGASFLAFTRIYQRVKSEPSSGKPTRLPAISLFSSGLMIYSAYLMYSYKGYWILPIFIVSILELYVSFRSSGKKDI